MTFIAAVIDRLRMRPALKPLAVPLYSWSLSQGTVPERLMMAPVDAWPADAGRGKWLCNGVLDLHGMHVPLEGKSWHSADIAGNPAKARAVHGFEWLRDLRAVGGDQARRQGRALIASWIEANHRWNAHGWDEATTGMRLANWLSFFDFFCVSADDEFLNRLFTAFIRQMRHLERAGADKFTDVAGLAAIKGLVLCALCLEGGEQKLDYALHRLEHWLTAEIMPDGGHVSRGPEKMVMAARHLVDIRAALVRGEFPAPPLLQQSLERLTAAIRSLRMADQKLALFHGAQEGDANMIDAVLVTSGTKPRKNTAAAWNHAGYSIMCAGRAHLVADTGLLPAAPYDAQVHVAPLAFEFAFGRDRMIVNCGSHPLDDVWADHLRATAAHSGLVLNDRNAAEIRKDGHVGRQPMQVQSRFEQRIEGLVLSASHDGYLPLNGLTHRRNIFMGADGHELHGEDILSADTALARPVPFTIRFHLHPRVVASVIQEGEAVLLKLPGGSGWRFHKEGARIALEPGIYMGSGSMPRKTQQIVIAGVAQESETLVRWVLGRDS